MKLTIDKWAFWLKIILESFCYLGKHLGNEKCDYRPKIISYLVKKSIQLHFLMPNFALQRICCNFIAWNSLHFPPRILFNHIWRLKNFSCISSFWFSKSFLSSFFHDFLFAMKVSQFSPPNTFQSHLKAKEFLLTCVGYFFTYNRRCPFFYIVVKKWSCIGNGMFQRWKSIRFFCSCLDRWPLYTEEKFLPS